MNTFLMISRFMNKTFALWVVVFGALGFVFPQVFKPVGAYVSILLGVVMFGMGLTLTTADFREIFRRPKDVAVGILAQFLIMPLAAFVLCKAFDLPPDLAVGLMLLGCVPGGTASNVVTFLARGDVALSVTVTSCTTLLAPVVTPALMYAFASQWLSIDPTAMFMSIVQVILVPIAAGVIVHKIFGAKVERVAAVLPIVSVGAVVVIVAAVVAATRSQILTAGMAVVLRTTVPAHQVTVSGDMGSLAAGCTAAMTVDYYTLGLQAAQLGADILEGRRTAAETPIGVQDVKNPTFNVKAMKRLGLEIPEDLKAGALLWQK